MEGKESTNAAIDEEAFLELEQDFQRVIDELEDEEGLNNFRIEFKKLHQALGKSHQSERRLMHKCRQLNAEIVANSSKVSTALKISEEDQKTIASLKKELEKAWKMLDAATEKENRTEEDMKNLKLEIENLNKLIWRGSGVSEEQQASLDVLMEQKAALSRERDSLLADIVSYRKQTEDLGQQLQNLAKEKEECESNISTLKDELQERNMQIDRETRKKERLTKDVTVLKDDNQKKLIMISQMKEEIEVFNREKEISESQYRDQRADLDKSKKEVANLKSKMIKVRADSDQKIKDCDILNAENQEKASELKRKESELKELKQQTMKIEIFRDKTLRKAQALEREKEEIEHQKDAQKLEILKLEKELEEGKKLAIERQKKEEGLLREHDTLIKNLQKAREETERHEKLGKIHDKSKKALQMDIQNYEDEASKQRKIIFTLEQERDRYITDASQLTEKVLEHMEEVKVSEMQIFDLKKKIAETETKLRQQQNLYEAVRSDRNLYTKNYIEATDEITEMKRKLKIMTHQIDQLKEEVSGKEEALAKQKGLQENILREKETLKGQLEDKRKRIESTEMEIKRLNDDAEKMKQTLQQANNSKVKQQKALEQIMSERDVLGTQLVRRNDELALLYEKIKIQQSALDKGERQYSQRLGDIRLLKLEVKKVRRERVLLGKTMENSDELKREQLQLQRQLVQERTRAKALEQEMENPLNVHRWRRLQASDPGQYELLQKMQLLQKRLIRKTEQVVQKELQIQEREKLYLELKQMLARQPGPELAEQLNAYHTSLKQKTKQMKAMASEMNMYETQIEQYKQDLGSLENELQEIKEKYFKQKKKNSQKKGLSSLNKEVEPLGS